MDVPVTIGTCFSAADDEGAFLDIGVLRYEVDKS